MNSSCQHCGKILASQRALGNHLKTKHGNIQQSAKVFHCGHCPTGFTQSKNLLRHLRSVHKMTNQFRCSSCPTFYGCSVALSTHEKEMHSTENVKRSLPEDISTIEFSTKALKSHFQIHRLNLGESSFIEPFNCLISLKDKIMGFVNSILEVEGNTKMGFSMSVRSRKPLVDDSTEAFFNSSMAKLSLELTEEEFLEHLDQIMSQLNVFATGGSGWVVEKMERFEIKTAKCATVVAGSYIETPPILQKLKRSLLNIVNKKDNFCFLYCVGAALFSFVGRAFRPKTHLENVQKLHFNAKQMPMPLSGIRSFEVRNRCSINVYQLDGRKLINIYSSKNKSQRRKVNLLRLVDGKRSHYCLIKNFSNLIHHLSRSPQKRSSGPKSRFCRNCYQPVLKQNMARHSTFCESNDPLEILMPKDDRILQFVNWQKTQQCPFVVYADLEALNVCQTETHRLSSKTREIERQFPASYGAVLVDNRG